MLTVHHLENSRSQRMLWLLEELGVNYEIKHYQRNENLRAPDALRAVHPLGKSPVITDGDFTLAETGAIVEYILTTYDADGQLSLDREHPNYWLYRHWLYYTEGSAMPPLVMKLVLDTAQKKAPFFVRGLLKAVIGKVNAAYANPEVQLHIDYWEDALSSTTWFAGDVLTAADIMMSFPLEAATNRVDYTAHPHCRAFLERIHSRSAYQTALRRGGTYAYA